MSSADLVLFDLLGGTALLLYGVRLVADGLQRAIGTRLRHLLTTLTGDRFRALGVGFGVTALLQSSTATTVLLVGFASAGLLSLRQTLGVILGADIGTTVTVQLLAFNLLPLAPLIVFFGWLGSVVARGSARHVGSAVLGFGFLFLGMKLISDSTAPLATSQLFRDLLATLSGQVLLLLILATAFAALVRSSAATIGVALALATAGVLPLSTGIVIVLGANIGTEVTGVIASIGQNVEARRVGIAGLAFKVVGAIVVLPFLAPLTTLAALTASDLPRQIANAHTLFNIALAAVLLPFAGPVATLLTRLVPEEPRPARGTMYLDPRALATPAVALGLALRETLRMGDLVGRSLREAITVFERNNDALREDIVERDDEIDDEEEEIKQYLIGLSGSSLTGEQAERETSLIFVIANLEQIGDAIEANLMELAYKKSHGGHTFSAEGWHEIVDLHAKVVENLDLALSALATQDVSIADKVLRHKTFINRSERELRQTHIDRLRKGLHESIDTSSIHLDVLATFKRVNSLIAGIAYAVLGRAVPKAQDEDE